MSNNMPDRVEFVKYIPLTASIRSFQGGYQIWGREKGGGLWCCAEVMESVGV